MPKITLTADKAGLVLIHSDGVHSDIMSTAEVESSIAALAVARDNMVPPIPETWTPLTAVEAERDPRWFPETDHLAGDFLLHLRDHHFGWRHYIFSKAEARKLGEALIAQADAPPPASAGRA